MHKYSYYQAKIVAWTTACGLLAFFVVGCSESQVPVLYKSEAGGGPVWRSDKVYLVGDRLFVPSGGDEAVLYMYKNEKKTFPDDYIEVNGDLAQRDLFVRFAVSDEHDEEVGFSRGVKVSSAKEPGTGEYTDCTRTKVDGRPFWENRKPTDVLIIAASIMCFNSDRTKMKVERGQATAVDPSVGPGVCETVKNYDACIVDNNLSDPPTQYFVRVD